MSLPFTSGERVLIHLLQRGSTSDPISNLSDQETIALECAIGRTHVPRVLAPLISESLVVEGVGRAPGRQRRVKVYRLTASGVQAARDIMARAREERLSWTGPDGVEAEDLLMDAARRLNDDLTAVKRPAIPLSVLLSTTGRLRWNELLWLSASMGTAVIKGYCIPKGYAVVPPPKPPFKLVGRASELGVLDRLLKEDGFAVITGEAGMGKRTLVLGHATLRGHKVLWLARGASEEVCMDEGNYDLIALKGPGDMDLSGVLISGGELDIGDPRDGSWPEQIRTTPMVVIVEGKVKVKGTPIVLKGLPVEVFVNNCVEAGLKEKVSRALHAACGGAPLALNYVRALPPDEVAALSGMGTDDAVLRVLLGLNGPKEVNDTGSSSKD